MGDGWTIVERWLGNGFAMVERWLVDGWAMAGQLDDGWAMVVLYSFERPSTYNLPCSAGVFCLFSADFKIPVFLFDTISSIPFPSSIATFAMQRKH